MFSILIVEDDQLTFDQIKKLIEEEISECRVDTAETVLKALDYIRKNANQPYDAIILDFKLPYEKPSDDDNVDETVCREARLLMPEALMVHITAYHEDETILRHLKEEHETQFGNKAIRLWKLDVSDPTVPTVADELMDRLKPELYGQRVMHQLHNLFNLDGRSRSSSHNRGRFTRSIRTGHSRTHDLGSVTREITAFWPYLNPDVKHQVKSLFSVKENDNKVTISLFRSLNSVPKE